MPSTPALAAAALLGTLVLTGTALLVRRAFRAAGSRLWPVVATALLAVAAAAAIGAAQLGAVALATVMGPLVVVLAGWLLYGTEQRQRELRRLVEAESRKLVDSEQTLNSIVENAPEAVLVASPVGQRVAAANPFAAAWLGVPRETLVGARLEEILAAPDNLQPDEVLRRTSTPSGQSDRFVLFRHADGHTIEAEVSSAAIVFRGRPAFVLMARDVSMLEKARRAAEAASQARNDFLANVSHEIRTPLNGVIGMTELALDEQLAERPHEMLQTALDCARELLSIVDDVLDFSRLEAGQLDFAADALDLAELAQEVLAHVAPRARAKELLLAGAFRKDLPVPLVGDAARLRKVLAGLTGNAVKFTHEGEVELTIHPEPAERAGTVNVRFAVRDTGVGIAADALETIFEPFRQADGSFTRQHGGTGLGLAIAQQIVSALGGRIEVTSEVARGSTFSFTIPMALGPGAAPRPPVPGLLGRALLVVHGSPAAQASLGESLLGLGVRARVVPDLFAASQAARAAAHEGSSFDGALIDVALLTPSRLEEVRRALFGARASSAALLAVATRPSRELSAGVDETVILPLSAAALHDALERSLAPGRQEAADPRTAAVERPRVLVVEDNPVNRRLVVVLLERAGYEVITAENGAQALERLAADAVHLVLMDVQMPVLDGLAATRRIRATPALAHLPVVALTAHALASDRHACLAAGMNDYLSKPVDRDALLGVVSHWLACDPAGTARG